MKNRIYLIPVYGMLFFALFTSCKNRNERTKGPQISTSTKASVDKEPEDTIVFVNYTPKATFTTIRQMEAQIPDDPEKMALGLVNEKFLHGCYYTGDTSTPFLASFAERWNKTSFLRRFINAEEIFERENSNVGDSLTTETVRGKMPMLPNEYQLAFKNATCRAMAKKLVRMLTTIDYVPEQTEKMAQSFQKLANVPYDTPEFLTDEERDDVGENFWTLYDKTKYVADYKEILKKRVPEEVDQEELENLSLPLQKRYLAEDDFDAKCIYALEMACYNFPDQIDYLGELIEDGRYSKYLYEVWVSWRLRAQDRVYGVSTYSEIPDNLYDNARLLVAQAFAKHIVEHPEDTLAKYLLMNLTYTENLHRAGGYYGNEALGASLVLRTQYFLPEEEYSTE